MPVGLRRELMLEAGWKCAVLRCNHETGLEVHHIDGDPANNEHANLIVLCAVHHRQATFGDIDATACRELKALLRGDRCEVGFVELPSKNDVNAALCREIQRTTSFRAILSGPYFLHPEWVFERRRKRIQHEDFDLKLKQFIEQKQGGDKHDIRIMCSNSDRYSEKVRQLVRSTELPRFQSDVLAALESLWQSEAAPGPDLCCVHPGFGHIAYIFDEAVITQFRVAQLGPTRNGHLWRSSAHIQRETTWFDTIFDSASIGQMGEVEKLRNFILTLHLDAQR